MSDPLVEQTGETGARPRGAGSRVGQEMPLEVGAVAHGGHCVARDGDLVVFVRHALPGERVRARITAGKDGDRFVFADAVEVLEPSPHRVAAPCPYARPAGCGGCDFQHVELDHQRELKRAVLVEQLARLGGVTAEVTGDVTVEPLPGCDDGLGWRTRMELAVDRSGRPGLRPHRSRAVVPVDDCLLADPRLRESGVFARRFRGSRAVHAVVSSTGEKAVVAAPQGLRRTPTIHEVVPLPGAERTAGAPDAGEPSGEVTFRLNALGFWQVHPAAAATFAATVLRGLKPAPGERCLDLYAGVGLFARALADAVGPGGAVIAVESDARACRAAAAQFAEEEHVQVWHSRVDAALERLGAAGERVDLVVLDTPRAGAGTAEIAAIAGLSPRAIAYVACDPASLARDVAAARAHGYEIAGLAAYDAFPMTHHLETIAFLAPARP